MEQKNNYLESKKLKLRFKKIIKELKNSKSLYTKKFRGLNRKRFARLSLSIIAREDNIEHKVEKD